MATMDNGRRFQSLMPCARNDRLKAFSEPETLLIVQALLFYSIFSRKGIIRLF